MGKVYRRLPSLLRPRATSQPSFQFELVLDLYCRPYNRRNIVPCIVDFFLKKRLRDFINNYSRNPAVLVSSLEAYDFIQKTGLAKHVNTRHLALSLPDAYRLHPSAVFEKKYDLVLCGRQNPVLRGFLEQYLQTHPDFHYVYWKDENGKRVLYTSTGECLYLWRNGVFGSNAGRGKGNAPRPTPLPAATQPARPCTQGVSPPAARGTQGRAAVCVSRTAPQNGAWCRGV